LRHGRLPIPDGHGPFVRYLVQGQLSTRITDSSIGNKRRVLVSLHGRSSTSQRADLVSFTLKFHAGGIRQRKPPLVRGGGGQGTDD